MQLVGMVQLVGVVVGVDVSGGGTKTMALVAAWTRLARVAEKIGQRGWKGMPVAAEAMKYAQVREKGRKTRKNERE